MADSKRNSLLCPNCRKLISSDEPRCPHCGVGNPGSILKNNLLTRNWGSGEQLIRLIIYTNIAMFLFSLVINPGSMRFGFNPMNFFAPDGRSLMILGATGTWMMNQTAGWWTLIAANYLHGSVLHIFFNLMALYQISPLVMQLFGPYRYFIIFTVSGVFGFLVSYLAGIPLTIGVSAALCGLIGAAIFYGKHRGGLFGQTVYRQIGGWAIGIILIGFLVPRINNYAHIGGMIAGALTAFIAGYNERAAEGLAHRITAGAFMILTVLVLLWSILRGIVALIGL